VAAGRLNAVLRSIRQGDVISLGAVAIVGTHASEVLEAAGDPQSHQPGAEAGVASVTIESASGWYAVLSQDCDIVREVDLEPCLHVAPVVYVEEDAWARLDAGQTSYRQFALPPDRIGPRPPSSPSLAEGRKPVVDIRYVTSVDKTALLTVADVDRRTPLGPAQRARFGQWVGSRYARVPFEDRVVETVLPAVRPVLEAMAAQLGKTSAGQRRPAVTFTGCVSEWYVRQMERNVEIMGRLDPAKMRAAKVLKTVAGEPQVNEDALRKGADGLRRAMIAKLPAGAGYALAVTFFDFDELTATEFETYAPWIVQDDPEASQVRGADGT
jgi:hypothetical protein